jgi:hypothetical protein
MPSVAVPFQITNQTGQPVHFTMYGIDASTGQWSYFSANSTTGNTFAGSLVPAQQLGAGNDLPTYSFEGSSATFTVPATASGISSAAIVITVGSFAPSITVAANFTLPRPAPSNPTLVNETTNPYYDYIEFTLDGNSTLFINTTQVDQFGFPITLSASPEPAEAPVGVTPGVTREAIFQAFTAFLNQQQDSAALDYLPLLQTADSGSPYRIIAPGQYLAIPGQSSDPLNGYFDEAISTFFSNPPPLELIAFNPYGNSGDPGTYTFIGTATTRNPVASGDLINGVPHTNPADNRAFAVIDFVGQPGSGSLTGEHFYVYSPIDPPSWVGTHTTGEQVFANNGVFADNVTRHGAPTSSYSANGLKSIVLGNLENQVVSALTRGIANLPTPAQYASTTAFWTDPAQAFPAGQKSNLYAKFLHTGQINGSDIFIDGRVYAFPYSDQGDRAAFFAVNNPTSVFVTLGPWSDSVQTSPTITSPAAPTTASVDTVYSYLFTATGTPAPALNASGLPGWLSFNAGTGLLTGVPTAADAGTSTTVTLTASNGVAPDAVMTFTINVADEDEPPVLPAIPVIFLVEGKLQFRGIDGSFQFEIPSPFGPDYYGKLRYALADLTGDGISEVILAPGRGVRGSPITVLDGETLEVLNENKPYGNRYARGVHLAVTERSGETQLVVGPGGGRRAVLFLNPLTGQREGKLFPFGRGYRGPIIVAAGGPADTVDLAFTRNGRLVKVFHRDGSRSRFAASGSRGDIASLAIANNQIVAGSAGSFQGLPRVQFFSSSGQRLDNTPVAPDPGEFVQVRTLADLNGDGWEEVLAQTPDGFALLDGLLHEVID